MTYASQNKLRSITFLKKQTSLFCDETGGLKTLSSELIEISKEKQAR